MTKDKIRIGIAGGGFVAGLHMDAYQHVENARVVAVADKREENAVELAERTGAEVYTDFVEMVKNAEIDALDVCLPTPIHKKAVLEAFAQGLDVVVEKPFALDLDEIDEIIARAKETGRRLMVAHVCRFIPEYVFAHSLVEQGELGRPLFFGAWRESATPNWSWHNWLHDRKQSGGTIMDLQIHDLDVSNWLLGSPEDFYAREALKPGLEGPSHVTSNLGYSGGAAAAIEAGHLMPEAYPFTTGYRLVLEKGVIEARSREGERLIAVITDDGVRQVADKELLTNPGNDPYAGELAHFVDCLLTGNDFKISMQDARLAVKTVRRLMASLKQGERVEES